MSQNQLAVSPEMLQLESFKTRISFWDPSQMGKEGPKWHDRLSSSIIWNGGIQLELISKMSELVNKNKDFSLLNVRKCVSEITTVNSLSEISCSYNSDSSPKMSGRVPFSLFEFIRRWAKCCKIPMEAIQFWLWFLIQENEAISELVMISCHRLTSSNQSQAKKKKKRKLKLLKFKKLFNIQRLKSVQNSFCRKLNKLITC